MHADSAHQFHESAGEVMSGAAASTESVHRAPDAIQFKPRLGFAGVGWIGLNRMEAIAKSGIAEVAAIADSSPEMVERASGVAPEAQVFSSLINS